MRRQHPRALPDSKAAQRRPAHRSRRGRWCRLVFGCVLACSATQAAFQIRTAQVNGIRYLLLRDIATYYAMTYEPGKKQARLRSRYSDLRFTTDRRESTLNKVRVHLSHAPGLWTTEHVLSEADFRLLLDPVLRSKALPRKTVRRICLDPGHGGADQGAKGKRHAEKTVTLQVVQRLARLLRARGYHVYLTRTGDTTVSLGRRPSSARACRADLFLSIHANSTRSSTVRGVETFLLPPVGTSSTYKSKPHRRRANGNRFDRENARLAYEVQKGLIAGIGGVDRGVKHASFLVLRDAPCPAALVEMGFLSHRTEENALGSGAHQEKIARSLETAVVAYHRAVAGSR